MTNPIEMEKKFRVNPADLAEFLKNKNFISNKTIVDEYLDTPEGLFYQEGIFIRVRNKKSLDIKFNPDHLGHKDSNDHTSCHEYNISMPFDPASAVVFVTLEKMIPIKFPAPYTYDAFLKINNLESLLTLDKKRSTYEDDIFLIAVDEFADFGTFLELEAKDNNISLEVFLDEIKKATQGMAIQEFNSGYVEIRLSEINHSLYLKGKYLIDQNEKAVAA